MPKIGMPSCAMLATRWLTSLKTAVESGFDAFEISCVFPSADPENSPLEVITKAREIQEKSGIEICVHAPFHDMNIAAFSPGIRRESIQLIKKSIELCAAVGGKTLIVHSGVHTYERRIGHNTKNNPLWKLQWDYNIESLKQVNDYANICGITVCLENIGFNSMDQSFEDLLEIRKAVGGSLQFTLDFGHARLCQGAAEGIRLLSENIRHIHLHDNYGKTDDHLPVGDGDYDFSGFVEFLNQFPHIITLEVIDISKDPQPALRSRDNFQKLLT